MNEYEWEYGKNIDWDEVYYRLDKSVIFNFETSEIKIEKNVCTLPLNYLYSYIQDKFDEPKFMQYPIPISAQTPQSFTIVNGWKLNKSNIMVGRYFCLKNKSFFWGTPSSKENRYNLDPNNENIFVGDYILYIEPTHPYRNRYNFEQSY